MIKIRQKRNFQLDPESNRYRVCPYCGEAHMVKHLGRDYCSKKCADNYHNEKKRLLKQAESLIQEEAEIENQMKVEIPAQETPAIEEKAINAIDPVQWTNKMKKNIWILDAIAIDKKKGSYFYVEELLNRGFNFAIYSYRAKLHNIDPKEGCHFLILGDFKIYSIDYGKVLICKDLKENN